MQEGIWSCTLSCNKRLINLQETIPVNMDGVQQQEDVGSFLEKEQRSWLAGILKLKHILLCITRKTVTEGVFNSVVVHCLPLYWGCDTGQTKTVQVLQNKTAQIVCKAPSRALMFDKPWWMTVNQLICYWVCCSSSAGVLLRIFSAAQVLVNKHTIGKQIYEAERHRPAPPAFFAKKLN